MLRVEGMGTRIKIIIKKKTKTKKNNYNNINNDINNDDDDKREKKRQKRKKSPTSSIGGVCVTQLCPRIVHLGWACEAGQLPSSPGSPAWGGYEISWSSSSQPYHGYNSWFFF
jgi:hypothetical protein